MHMNLFFDHYFDFLGAKTKINKSMLNLISLDGLEASKRQTPGTQLGNTGESFWIWCDLKNISIVFEATFS